MEQLIKDIESRKKGEKYFDFCLDDAIFHIRKAQEILDAAEEDPEDWFIQQQQVAKTFVQVLPFLLASNCTMTDCNSTL